MKKVFLDTNIFIDFFDETRVNNEQAKQLIYFLISNEIKIVFSEDMIST
ncbi:DNA-binding protein, partial [Campylobacter jejuni]|nr:DNA-binding protein [Campylobacter jejuni]